RHCIAPDVVPVGPRSDLPGRDPATPASPSYHPGPCTPRPTENRIFPTSRVTVRPVGNPPSSPVSDESAPPRCDRSEVCVVLPRRSQRQGVDRGFTRRCRRVERRAVTGERAIRHRGAATAGDGSSSRRRRGLRLLVRPAVLVALSGLLVDLPLGPAWVLRANDLPAARPRRPASRTNLLAVDR